MKLAEPIICPFTIVVDSREQAPWSFLGLTANADKEYAPLAIDCNVQTLPTGDYSIKGFEDSIVIERKSLGDAFGTFTHDRPRWEREMDRMRKIPCCHVVIEGSLEDLRKGPKPRANYKDVEWEPLDGSSDYSTTNEFLDDSADLPITEQSPTSEQIRVAKIGKSIDGSITAWRVRFPHIQWWFEESRQRAEETAFNILDRFWKDDQWQLKELKKLSVDSSKSSRTRRTSAAKTSVKGMS